MKSEICHDCGAKPGEYHTLGCDVALCPACGDQAMVCLSEFSCPGCNEVYLVANCDGSIISPDEQIPWSGEWPGLVECREFDWYAKLIPGRGWVACDKSDPEATEDLNRLHREMVWDRGKRKLVLRVNQYGGQGGL